MFVGLAQGYPSRRWGYRPGPRHELFVYVDDLETVVAELRSTNASVLRNPTDMPWGERVAFVVDPESNIVSLAAST